MHERIESFHEVKWDASKQEHYDECLHNRMCYKLCEETFPDIPIRCSNRCTLHSDTGISNKAIVILNSFLNGLSTTSLNTLPLRLPTWPPMIKIWPSHQGISRMLSVSFSMVNLWSIHFFRVPSQLPSSPAQVPSKQLSVPTFRVQYYCTLLLDKFGATRYWYFQRGHSKLEFDELSTTSSNGLPSRLVNWSLHAPWHWHF